MRRFVGGALVAVAPMAVVVAMLIDIGWRGTLVVLALSAALLACFFAGLWVLSNKDGTWDQ